MTQQFNRLTCFVAHTVLEFGSAAERALALQFFIALAARLFEINNFHSSYAVLCGLNASSIQRLQKSWKKVSKKHSTKLEELMALNSHSKNYKQYRQHIRSVKPPMVPQIGIISRDLFGLEENNDDYVECGGVQCVNVQKARVLEKITGEMLAVQSEPYAALPKVRRGVFDGCDFAVQLRAANQRTLSCASGWTRCPNRTSTSCTSDRCCTSRAKKAPDTLLFSAPLIVALRARVRAQLLSVYFCKMAVYTAAMRVGGNVLGARMLRPP